MARMQSVLVLNLIKIGILEGILLNSGLNCKNAELEIN